MFEHVRQYVKRKVKETLVVFLSQGLVSLTRPRLIKYKSSKVWSLKITDLYGLA